MLKSDLKLLSIVLLCSLIFFVCSCGTSKSVSGFSVAEPGKHKVSSLIFTQHGFRLVEQKQLAMVEGSVYILEHVKSGASVYFVDADDSNSSFSITVNTPPESDCGEASILSKMIFASTKTYPGKNLLPKVEKNTLNTFMGSFVSETYSQFLFSSKEPNQFMKLADYYMSAVFEPDLNENSFKKNAWHYELDSASQPISLNGDLYKELTPQSDKMLYEVSDIVRESLFPDTSMRYSSKGKLSSLKKSSLESVCRYHDKYFVPSNSIIGIYGNNDIESILSLLDEKWLSKFERKAGAEMIPLQPSFEKSKYIYRSYPVSASSDIENGTVLSKGFALGEVTEKDIPVLLLTANILNNQNSSLMQTLKANKIAENFYVRINFASRQPQFEIIAQGCNSSKASTFEKIVTDCFSQIIEQGVKTELFEAVKNDSYALGLLARENTSVGLEFLMNMSAGQMVLGSKYAMATSYYDMQNLDVSSIQNCLKKYFGQNKHSVLVVLEPKNGLIEKNLNDEKSELDAYKKQLGSKGVEKLVNSTAAFKSWLKSQDSQEDDSLKKIQLSSPAELSVCIEDVEITESYENGIRYIKVPVPGRTINTSLLLDISQLNKEELCYARLYMSMLGNLAAGTLKKEQTDQKLSAYILGMKGSVDVLNSNKSFGEGKPVLSLTWFSDVRNLRKAEELMSLVLSDTILDPGRVKYLVAVEKASVDNMYQNNMAKYASLKAKSSFGSSYFYEDVIKGYNYYCFIQKAYTSANKNPSDIIEKIIAVREKMLVKNNPVIITIGPQNIETSGAGVFLSEVLNPAGKLETGISKTLGLEREAVTVKDSLNYTCTAQKADSVKKNTVDTRQYAAELVAADILTDIYASPKLKFGGAADGGVYLEDGVIIGCSMRDPQLDNTIEMFRKSSAFEMSKRVKDNFSTYIINRYAREISPKGIYSHAYDCVIDYLRGFTQTEKYAYLEDLKKLTVEDVQERIKNMSLGEKYTVFATAPSLKGSSLKFDKVTE